MEEKWVVMDVWYNVGDSHCSFFYLRFNGIIEHAKNMFKSAYVDAVKVWDKKETYLYLKK